MDGGKLLGSISDLREAKWAPTVSTIRALWTRVLLKEGWQQVLQDRAWPDGVISKPVRHLSHWPRLPALHLKAHNVQLNEFDDSCKVSESIFKVAKTKCTVCTKSYRRESKVENFEVQQHRNPTRRSQTRLRTLRYNNIATQPEDHRQG
ncbi:hypothetical protein NDU88_001173 [Pleurodeles waltl]|uniref:C2H2-type domain-containing protein n=1 Tax=Pleurodeles waltl TaxID=8319 RepID=A0AAV7U7C4_PLEWA|nr:hypothetical protein NDU88_001173 [Pleurodeles waltl]